MLGLARLVESSPRPGEGRRSTTTVARHTKPQLYTSSQPLTAWLPARSGALRRTRFFSSNSASHSSSFVPHQPPLCHPPSPADASTLAQRTPLLPRPQLHCHSARPSTPTQRAWRTSSSPSPPSSARASSPSPSCRSSSRTTTPWRRGRRRRTRRETCSGRGTGGPGGPQRGSACWEEEHRGDGQRSVHGGGGGAEDLLRSSKLTLSLGV